LAIRECVASVCIPTRNRAEMLRIALASAQAQTERRIEIVVTDNASDDSTEDVVRSAAQCDDRVRYVRNDRDLGMVGNWNRCLAEARAPLMCLVSDDDTLAPAAIATGVDLLRRYPEASIAIGARRHVHARTGFERLHRPTRCVRLLAPAAAHRIVWLTNGLPLTHSVFRTDPARAIGGFVEEVGWNADTCMLLLLTAHAPAVVTPVEMGTYRVHDNQLTGTRNADVYAGMERMVEHVMERVAGVPGLIALRRLAEREYLSRYAIHFAAAAERQGRPSEAEAFLLRARALGLPSSLPHRLVYGLLCLSHSVPGGSELFRLAAAPVLRRLAARFG